MQDDLVYYVTKTKQLACIDASTPELTTTVKPDVDVQDVCVFANGEIGTLSTNGQICVGGKYMNLNSIHKSQYFVTICGSKDFVLVGCTDSETPNSSRNVPLLFYMNYSLENVQTLLLDWEPGVRHAASGTSLEV